jgi:hypothetical protein
LAVLTASHDFTSRTFGRFTVYSWKKVETDGNYVIARLTVLTSKLADFSFPVTPVPAVYLQPSTVNTEVSKVRRFGTAVNGVPCCIGVTDKPVILEAGNNISISLAEEQETFELEVSEAEAEVRVPTTIVITAEPGAGTGAFPSCTSISSDINRIGGVPGDDNGNLHLDMRDCLWPERRLASATSPPIHNYTDYLADIEESLLQLHANCKACCSCDDYGSAYKLLKSAFERAKNVSKRIERVRQDYVTLRQDVIDLAAERQTGLTVKLRLQTGPDFSMAISATVGNNSCETIETILLKITVNDSAVQYTPLSGRFEGEGIHDLQLNPVITSVSGGKTFTVSIASIKSTKYARYRFSARIGPGLTTRVGRSVTVNAKAYENGVLKSEDSSNVELSAPLEKS